MIVFNHLRFLPYYEQIRSVWEPVVKSCIVTNVEICKLSIVSFFVADTILLFIMLAGLLRLRRRGSGSHKLWHFLWKQVGHWRFSLVVLLTTDAFDGHEGIIWFVVAAVAELPPAVSLASFIVPK
jgi:hypothetical protein